MSELLECRGRLESAHKEMQEAMTELITNKNYSEVDAIARCRQAHGGSDRGYGRDRRPIRFMDVIPIIPPAHDDILPAFHPRCSHALTTAPGPR
jgi:hypothetical protein